VVLGVAFVLSALMLVAWFPAGALLQQRAALSKTDATISHLRQQDRQLEHEKALLSQPSEVQRIARQDYGLVSPGQRSYEILPRSSNGSINAYAGDPGLQPLAAPNSGALPGGSVGSGSSSSAGGSHGGSHPASGSGTTGTSHASGSSTPATPSPGVWGRIVGTLEFWH
jgi:cell division protein FtsB